MRQFKTIDDLDVAGKTVLVRCDLNVPMKDGKVSDATRLERSAVTLSDLAAAGARVCVLSHFGRPKGRPVADMSLKPVAEALSGVLSRPVAFAPDCIGAQAEAVVRSLRDGEVCVLENLRFHAGEEANDREFAGKLAALGDLYVNDAFSVSHRAHASTEAIARILPAAAGRLMQAELDALTKALEAPEHPVAAVVGGAKVSTKMEVLGNLVAKVDLLIIGGGMANTFLHAQGLNVGRSLCEHDMADAARGILARAEQAGCVVALPVDAVVAREFKEGAASEVVGVDAVPDDAMMLDVGPRTVRDLTERLKDCRTLVWNGPLGAFEIKPFDAGTNALARAAADLTTAGTLTSVAGGGDTVAALANAGAGDAFSYVSAAGGAFLEWLEGKDLPGVAALRS
ncbi:MAG: phosphoglycerate kinase [Rhodospirillales bacterium CG15_BIG_FIL_POST_REV_8_21_14_020_66_15]|nr:MAG: phosphoglycerate kinase [Rhodospirillales bacterium CG15_BIG_FIL_POST_REV_8_21_14_020_66_15]